MTTARSGRPRSRATPAIVAALVSCSGVRASEEPDTWQRPERPGPSMPREPQASPARTATATSAAGHQDRGRDDRRLVGFREPLLRVVRPRAGRRRTRRPRGVPRRAPERRLLDPDGWTAVRGGVIPLTVSRGGDGAGVPEVTSARRAPGSVGVQVRVQWPPVAVPGERLERAADAVPAEEQP